MATTQSQQLEHYIKEAETNFITNRLDDAGNEFNLIADRLNGAIDNFYFRYRAIHAFETSENKSKLIKSLQMLGNHALKISLFHCEKMLKDSVTNEEKEFALYEAVQLSKTLGQYEQVESLLSTIAPVYQDLFHDESIAFEQKLAYMERNLELSNEFMVYEEQVEAKKRIIFIILDEFKGRKKYYIQNEVYQYTFANYILKAIALALEIDDEKLVRNLHECLMELKEVLDDLDFGKYGLDPLQSAELLDTLLHNEPVSDVYSPGDSLLLDGDGLCEDLKDINPIPIEIIQNLIKSNENVSILLSEMNFLRFDKRYYLHHLKSEGNLIHVKKSKSYAKLLTFLAVKQQMKVITNSNFELVETGILNYVVNGDELIIADQ